MSLSRNVSEIIRDHVTLEVESIDRMYLNIYIPQLQRDLGVVRFFRNHRGQPFASSPLMADMTRQFVASIESFAAEHEIPMITFQKGQRKDSIAATYQAKFTSDEGILLKGLGPGESFCLPHGETTQLANWPELSVDCALHRDGQPLLHLRH